MGKKLLIDKQFVKCDFYIQDKSGARWGASNVNDLSFLTPGKKYTLQFTYDDDDLVETFDYLCNDYVLQGEHIYVLGNPYCFDGLEDNGEPLSFMYSPSYKASITAWNIGSWEENEGFTFYVSIFEEAEDIVDSSVSFGAFLANPKYRFGAFRGLFGWLSTRKKAPILPNGYTQQEYIESDGLYCIDTGYYPNQSTGFYADFIPYNEISGTEPEYGSIFGGRESSRLNEFQLTTYRGNPSFGGTFRYGNAEYNPGLETGVRTVATFRNGKYSSSLGASFDVTPTEFASPVPMTLFAVNNGGRIGQCGKVRLFALRFYEGNELVRNYIPCRNPNGQSGLWDLVTEQFYGFRAPASSYDVGFSESEGPSAG